MNWTQKPLKELGSLVAGIAFAPGLQGRQGLELPFAKVGDISVAAKTYDGELRHTRHSVSTGDLAQLGGRPIPENSIVFAKIGEAIRLNNQAITVRPTMIDNNVMAFLPDTRQLEFRYAVHAFQQINLYLLADKTTVPAIRKSRLADVQIIVPPLEEQKRIAAILDKADAIRRKREQAIQLADEFLRSLFLDMFGDPVRNPKGWPARTLGNLSPELRYGTSVKCLEFGEEGALPVLRIPNVIQGKLDFSNVKYASLNAREKAALLLQRGDVLFVRTNGNPNYIGRCAVFDQEMPAVFASYLIRARFSLSACVPDFLSALVMLPAFRAVMLREAQTTAGNYNISASSLATLPIILPPISKQRKFAEINQHIRHTFLGSHRCLALGQALSASVTQRAFKGDL